ncbi:hypothetical protein [Nocardia vaccinii]|uniref:hypothetical protein n=1 Tax=Nocardia vaccinii TaxID=1822 RepID=UPI0012F47FCC|nr:hypothetical protein [Nocardia vaccinii]
MDIRVAATAPEARRMRAAAADLSTYGHVSVVVALDPDNPAAVRAEVEVTPGAPCWAHAAKVLREIAGALEERHAGTQCGRHQ